MEGRHDGLQHVDRGRRARRHGRARRDDVRVPATAARARRKAPTGTRRSRAGATLPSDAGRRVRPRGRDRRRRAAPAGHLGHEPRHGRAGRRRRPRSGGRRRRRSRAAAERALDYMGLEPGTPIAGDRASTASSSARARTRGSRICAPRPRSCSGARCIRRVRAMVVPGSAQVKRAGRGGRARPVFTTAGFEWRHAGCSMCLGMNPDIARARRALRVDLEPQLRGPPGPRRPHASRQPGDGRRGRDRRPLRRRPRAGAGGMKAFTHASTARASPCSTGPTSTPTRSSRSSS